MQPSLLVGEIFPCKSDGPRCYLGSLTCQGPAAAGLCRGLPPVGCRRGGRHPRVHPPQGRLGPARRRHGRGSGAEGGVLQRVRHYSARGEYMRCPSVDLWFFIMVQKITDRGLYLCSMQLGPDGAGRMTVKSHSSFRVERGHALCHD